MDIKITFDTTSLLAFLRKLSETGQTEAMEKTITTALHHHFNGGEYDNVTMGVPVDVIKELLGWWDFAKPCDCEACVSQRPLYSSLKDALEIAIEEHKQWNARMN